jgi:hypothetical protein
MSLAKDTVAVRSKLNSTLGLKLSKQDISKVFEITRGKSMEF